MKTLKGFVQPRAHPKGSMAKGWLVQESLVYIADWISNFEKDSCLLWRDGMLEEKINNFCMLQMVQWKNGGVI